MEILSSPHQIYINNFWENRIGLDYLRSRGITEETCKKFKLGLHTPLLLSKSMQLNDLEKLKHLNSSILFDYVVSKTFNSTSIDYSTRVIFPINKIIDGKSELIGFKSRSLGDSGLKHRHLSEFYYNLYNEEILLSRPREIILCEGEVDLLTLSQNNYKAIGLLGVHTFTQTNARKLHDFGVKRAFIMFDQDPPSKVNPLGSGQKAALKTAEILTGIGIESRICNLPKIHGR